MKYCLLVFSHMEAAVGQPKTVLDVGAEVLFVFEEGNSSHPISFFDVFLEGWDFLLDLSLKMSVLLSAECLRTRSS